jgi:Transposase DDE domain
MTVNELLKLIPQETFRQLAAETKVDEQVKKLSGELMFTLILFSMINCQKVSLRVMETFLQSTHFKSFTGFDILDGKYNSIRDRICTMDVGYFEQLFATIFTIYNKVLQEEKALSRVDSTMISLPARLLSGGITNNSESKRFIKYGLTLKGSLPCSVKIFKDPPFASDDRALAEVVRDNKLLEGNVVVFDRGLRSRKALEEFSSDNKLFITRGYQAVKYEVVSSAAVPARSGQSTLTIYSDETGYLFNQHDRRTHHLYRIIRGRNDNTGEELCFITNIISENCYQIAEWYRQRWDIEVFFKFLKQHLNVKHLVSRTENGMKVMIYMTLIVAILILAYKKLNKIKSYKIAKLKFEIELDNEMLKAIVILCGGNPDNAPHLFRARAG